MARNLVRTLIAVPVVASVLWAGMQAMALRNAVATAPFAAPATAVATVDIGRLYGAVNMTSEWQQHVKQLKDTIKDEAKVKQDSLEKRLTVIEKITDPVQRDQEMDNFAIERLQADEWVKLRQIEVDRELALGLEQFIKLARDEAKKVADGEGYQLVLVDDSTAKIRSDPEAKAPREMQIQQQIAQLRILYAVQTVDITDKVKVRMNNIKATALK